MPGAVIVIDQTAGAGAGTPGVARNDLWEAREVTLHVGTTGNSSYQWDLLNKPAGSATEITNPLAETATFIPDSIGTYRIRLVVNGGGPGNIQILVARVRFDSDGALKNRGWAYPAVGEQEGENNYPGNDRSWAQIIEYILEDVRTNSSGITLAGDLAEWPGDPTRQQVIGVEGRPIDYPAGATWEGREQNWVFGFGSTFRCWTGLFDDDSVLWLFGNDKAVKSDGPESVPYKGSWPDTNFVASVNAGGTLWLASTGFVHRSSFSVSDLSANLTIARPEGAGSAYLAYDSDNDNVWSLHAGVGPEALVFMCISNSTGELIHSFTLPNDMGAVQHGFAYGHGYIWVTDYTGDVKRILPEAPWTVTDIPVMSTHPSHTPGNWYNIKDFVFVGSSAPRLYFLCGFANGTFAGDEEYWLLYIDVDSATFDIDTRYDLTPLSKFGDGFYTLSGLAYAAGSLWVMLGQNNYYGYVAGESDPNKFLKFGNLSGVRPELLAAIPAGIVRTTDDPYFKDTPIRVETLFQRPYVVKDDTIHWFGYGDTRGFMGENGQVTGAFNQFHAGLEQSYSEAFREISCYIPLSSIARYAVAADLTGPLERSIVSRLRAANVPAPTEEKVGGALLLETSKPTWESPCGILSDNEFLYVAECGYGEAAATAILRKFHVEWQDDGTLNQKDSPVLFLEASIDLASVITVDRISDIAQDAKYVYAACWDGANVAIIAKDTWTIAGWASMGGEQASSVCADGQGKFFCYSGTSFAVERFTTADCLGADPGTVTSEATYAGDAARRIRYGMDHIWQTDGGAGFGIRKIDPRTMSSVGTTAPVSGVSYKTALAAYGYIWVTYAGASNGLVRINPSSLALVADIAMGSATEPDAMCVYSWYLWGVTGTAGLLVADAQGTKTWEVNISNNSANQRWDDNVPSVAGLAFVDQVNSYYRTTFYRSAVFASTFDDGGSEGIYYARTSRNNGIDEAFTQAAYRFRLEYAPPLPEGGPRQIVQHNGTEWVAIDTSALDPSANYVFSPADANDSRSITIQGQSADTAGGGAVYILGGNTTGDGGSPLGGDVVIQGGRAEASTPGKVRIGVDDTSEVLIGSERITVSSPAISFTGGTGTREISVLQRTGSTGGSLSVVAGEGGGANYNGGGLQLTAGSGGSNALGGVTEISGGVGGTDGGAVVIRGGDTSDSGTGGNVEIQAGGGNVDGTGGSVEIYGGPGGGGAAGDVTISGGPWPDNPGGNVFIRGGQGGDGDDGTVTIGDSTTSYVYLGDGTDGTRYSTASKVLEAIGDGSIVASSVDVNVAVDGATENDVVYIAASDTITVALADVLATSRAMGVRVATNIVRVSGVATVGIEGTLVVAAGDDLYLSNSEAGKVTNVEPVTGYVTYVGQAKTGATGPATCAMYVRCERPTAA